MTAVRTEHLAKRFGRRTALSDCTVSIPEGRVVGIVGSNGAGKSTLLQLAVGLLQPSGGTITVLGEEPRPSAEHMARVGFVAQDAPVYASLTVSEHLRLGDKMNPGFDLERATSRVDRLGLDGSQRAGRLSGGQRSQLALTLAMSKEPELLVLDEPVASLDPLARREFLQDLMELAAERHPTVVLSSHLLSDVERVCDYLIVLAGGEVQVAGDVHDLLSQHRRLTGARHDTGALPSDQVVIQEHHTDRQTTLLVRTDQPILDPRWNVSEVGLEDLVLAYMEGQRPTRTLTAVPS